MKKMRWRKGCLWSRCTERGREGEKDGPRGQWVRCVVCVACVGCMGARLPCVSLQLGSQGTWVLPVLPKGTYSETVITLLTAAAAGTPQV